MQYIEDIYSRFLLPYILDTSPPQLVYPFLFLEYALEYPLLFLTYEKA